MKSFLQKLHFGARVLLARGGGEPETVDLPGRQVIVRRGGDGPAFVYLHSALGEGNSWLPYMQSWSRTHDVFVPLHPGFGTSGGFDRIDSIDDMVFHYAELFDVLGLDDFILGGHSLGGWIAAEFAVRYPHRIRKLWLSAAPGLWVAEQPLPDLFSLLQDRSKMRDLLFHDPDHAIAQLLFQKEPTDEQLKLGYQAMTVLARLLWRRPFSPRLAERLCRIACPTLLLWGENDRLVPAAYGQAYKGLIAQAELEIIPACGHLPMFEREKDYVNRVSAFVSR
jgi:pimeloyl-ACP methyl ester carboxylesterase